MNTTGAVRRIRERFPDAEFVLEGGPAATELMPELEVWVRRRRSGLLGKLNRVLAYRRRKFERAISLDDSRENIRLAVAAGIPDVVGAARKAGQIGKARILRVEGGHDMFAPLAAVLKAVQAGDDLTPVIPILPTHRSRAAELIPDRPVGLFVGSSDVRKSWLDERWVELARRLGGRSIFISGPGEEQLRLALSERAGMAELPTVNLLTLSACIERLRVLITGDTGPAHIAGAWGTRTVILYGPTDPDRFHPWGDRWTAIRKDDKCDHYGAGCGYLPVGAAASGSASSRCPRVCMAAIGVQDVLTAIDAS